MFNRFVLCALAVVTFYGPALGETIPLVGDEVIPFIPPSGRRSALVSDIGNFIFNKGIAFGIRDDSNATPATAGAGFAASDTITLNDGCQTHAVLAVNAVSSGGITKFNITNRGSCSLPPSNPVGVLSTSGAGTGAFFTLAWAPLSAGVVVGTLVQNDGNLFITNPLFSPDPGLSGSENTFVGYGAGGAFTGLSNFNTAMGHNACGIGGTAATGNQNSCFGTDAGRNMAGNSFNVTAVGGSALHDMNVGGINDITAIGSNAMLHQVGANLQNHSVAVGDSACAGAVGATFRSGICLGGTTGALLTSPFNFTIIGTGVGNATFTNGQDILLIGTGGTAVDTLSATVSHYMNIANVSIASLSAPTISSGFGTSPTIANGITSGAFQVNVGTGGTASSGVISLNSTAPHGWICSAVDGTNSATSDTVATPTSAQTITLTNYSRTTGALTAWVASDVVSVLCNGF